MTRLELFGPFVVEAATKTARKPDRHGWVRCTLPLESFESGAQELLRLGEEVHVIGPQRLRAELAATAARIAKAHGNPRRRGEAA